MIDFNHFYQCMIQHRLTNWLESTPIILQQWFRNHRDIYSNQYANCIKQLPIFKPNMIDLKTGVKVSLSSSLMKTQRQQLYHLLKALNPWRKGPYSIYGIHIDSEWRSDWKWSRLIGHIKPLAGRKVLDVGCNNGYYLWRILGEGANLAIGIDPIPLFLYQFEAIRKLIHIRLPAYLLPLGIEQLPASMAFDTVFSMGVLYHRRSPLDHLIQLKQQLVRGGELVLETLVIEGDGTQILIPKDRYAQMNNVYFIPSTKMLETWLYKCGFSSINLIDINYTSVQEQRRTEWATSNSLENYLNPIDKKRTIEGYPAPMRAIFTAKKG